MVRGPKSGNGMRSSVYSLAAPDLGSLDLDSLGRGWARPQARSLDEVDQLDAGYPSPRSGGAWNGAGEHALLPAPAPISLPPAAAQGSNPAAQSQLNNELPAFFQAYANGDSAALDRFLAPGVSLTGLGGAASFDSIAALHVPPGGASPQITVSVLWNLLSPSAVTGAKLQVTYRLSVVQQSGLKWYVKAIGELIEAVGAP